jgi:phosphate transport system substrate-binding protein
MAATSLFGQVVTLNSLDGSLSVSGELKEFTRDYYILSSNIGDLTISTSVVTCSGEACPSLLPKYSEFTISGSREMALNLMPLLLDGFSASLGLDLIQQTDESGNQEFLFATPEGEDIAKISFIMRGSSNGLKDLVSGRAAIALTTRVARPKEVSAFSAAGLGNLRDIANEHILALDGIVVITSDLNPVRIIKSADLAGIFSGEITDWGQLGGAPGPINLYIRPENSATGALFSQLIMRPARARLSRTGNALESDAAVTDAVSLDPNGIGFTSYSTSANAKTVSLLGACNIQSPATEFTIQAEEYPYTRRLYLYKSPRDVSPLIDQFIDYLGGGEAQKLIDLAGYVGQDIEEVPVNDQGLRFLSAALPTDAEMTLKQLQSMMQDLAISERISVTYRFEQGTAQLDSRAQADIGRLVDEILLPEFQHKKIILMGFTDSVGNGPNNERLSLARAEQVRTALLQEARGAISPDRIEVRGYGELSPLGCNEVVDGRRINRRVEVWER